MQKGGVIMITPIKQHSVNFKGNSDTKVLPFKDFKNPKEYYKEADIPVIQDTLENKPIEQTDTQQSKTALIKEKFNSAKLAFVNLAKTFNTTTGVTGGILSGVVKGALVTLGVGFIGKNVRKNTVAGAIKGMGSDILKAALACLKAIPSIITKAPVENVKNLLSIVPNYYTKYLKNHKGIATVATLAGVGAFILSTLHGKISANRANADLDHSVNTGHVPTK